MITRYWHLHLLLFYTTRNTGTLYFTRSYFNFNIFLFFRTLIQETEYNEIANPFSLARKSSQKIFSRSFGYNRQNNSHAQRRSSNSPTYLKADKRHQHLSITRVDRYWPSRARSSLAFLGIGQGINQSVRGWPYLAETPARWRRRSHKRETSMSSRVHLPIRRLYLRRRLDLEVKVSLSRYTRLYPPKLVASAGAGAKRR